MPIIKNLKKIKGELVAPPKIGEIIEAEVVAKERSEIFLDLGSKGIGIIYGKEFANAKDVLKKAKPGDRLNIKVLELENEDGYREVSLSGASEDLAWKNLSEAKEKNEPFTAIVKGANKGGLLCEVKNIMGFLPSSQLTPANYPKVEGADPVKIAQELQKLVGKILEVKIYSVDAKEKKLILSEKSQQKEKPKKIAQDFQEGQKFKIEVSGITNFGVFVKLPDDSEGLIYSDQIPENISLKIGDKAQAEIIKIEADRVYLSLK